MRSITTTNDHQNDLTKLALWSTTWQMPFNLAKCEHLTVSNKPHPSIYHYKINDYHSDIATSIRLQKHTDILTVYKEYGMIMEEPLANETDLS